MAITLQRLGHLGLPYTKETLIGLVFGIAALHLLAPRRRQAVDEHLGELSYGVFLNHFLLIWLGLGPQGPAGWAGFVALSCALAWLTWIVAERPVMTWRRRLRRAKAPRPDHPAPPAGAPAGE
jgi:peptidoglycan/LPS O-acetylase OafA/YrhL